ncbi:MAG: glycosyltransferase [Planctomycetaceae bacterium]|nr:glycosyltransferase [Planctomycetaceae bacterium]MCB9951655.1 glycosyltransferase [Planctomycetaceae bacterium]
MAVIFDNRPRPETTGLYCRRALGELSQSGLIGDVEHLLPDDLHRVQPSQFDLFLYVDDGIQHSIREDLRPAIWWGIDTHVSFDRCLKMAAHCDFTWTAQSDGSERLRQEGIKSASWLPLACDPAIHGHRETEKRFDVGFVGNLFPGPREQLLRRLQAEFEQVFVGQAYFEQMAEVYSASRIVFNRSIANDINMRVFEGLCSGSLLLTNDLTDNGLAELFHDGVHVATYSEVEELLDKAKFYLQHLEIREQLSAAGRREVLQRHTYRHRMETILQAVEQQPARTVSAPTNGMMAKDSFYFDFPRPDVLALVPQNAQRVLDIGCGAGRLGESIKRRQDAHVVGIERDNTAAEIARHRLDEVHSGDICADDFEFPDAEFDCVICADVLEHLRDPESVLRKVSRWLKPGGTLVTSLPNVRNHTVVRSLLAGNWTYESAGLLDEDHVRFFTKREIEKLLFRCGFEIEAFQAVPGDGFAEWERNGRQRQLQIGPFQLHAGSEAEAEEFFAYQYLTRSRATHVPEYPLTSIVLVTFNQLEYTKQCLDSIQMRTVAPYELIVVDNGSTDATVQYLRSRRDVRLIENAENRGFPAAANQGIKAARGEQVLLLNNDTLVTTGWLTRMLTALHVDETVGLVGPLSNSVSGQQQIDVAYDDLAQLDGFAWELGKQQHHQQVAVDRLVGFCLLFRRQLVDAIGLLDEQFGIGNFEDDDFCRRAQSAGKRCVIATDAFVHHFGSVTFRNSGVDFAGLLNRNQQLYERKWASNGNESTSKNSASQQQHANPSRNGCDLPVTDAVGTSRPRFHLDETDGCLLKLRENRVQLSACLIVRNNECTIGPCLESLVRWVDEIVIVDTGSDDATPRICEEYGARVYHWPWRDDFAAARNESFKYALGHWIFWMDSDDTLPWECGEQLRKLADGNHDPQTLGYVMQVHCPGDEPTDVTVVDHVKLIRNQPGLNFEFRIHEQILPAIRRAGGNVAWTDIYVVHSGATRDAAGRARKLARDYRLLHVELEERPDHPFTLFNLGMTYADDGKHEEAIKFLERCLEVSGPDESHVRKAYALLVSSLHQSERHEAALRRCTAGLQQFPGDPELHFRQGMINHQLEQFEAAIAAYQSAMESQAERHFQSADSGISSFKALHNIARVYEDMQRPDLAEAAWRRLTEDYPFYGAGWQGLVDLQLEQQDWSAATATASRIEQAFPAPNDSAAFRARILEVQGDWNGAREVLESYLGCYENHEPTLRRLCQLLFIRFEPTEALIALQRLEQLVPDDPSVKHNLGMTWSRLGIHDKAIEAFQASLQIRPNYEATAELLGQAYENQILAKHDVTPSMPPISQGVE